MKDQIPNKLKFILDNLIKNNIKPIIVGGSVRDYLYAKDINDFDIEVYGISDFNELGNILSKYGEINVVGKSFGVLKLKVDGDIYDFSFPRLENKIGIGHKGFKVKIDSSLTYKEAAKRRDFTINSIGYDYKDNKFLDPYNAIEDIKSKILKHIDDKKFCEDPLRVYRAIQLCGRFELKVDKKTKGLCLDIIKTEEFKLLSLDRISDEYKKLLLKSQKPSYGLNLLNEFKIQSINQDTIKNIDNMFRYKKDSINDNMILMYYFLFDILQNISNDKKLYKDIKKLQDFSIPKIFENDIKNIVDSSEFIAKKLDILKNMPKPFFMGKDLIILGYKPSKKFTYVLKSLYEMQLEGKISSKKEAEKYISTFFNN